MKTSHNTDARGPALCVKCYNLTRDVPADAEGSDDQQRRAYDETCGEWWREAEALAQRHGFRKVWATGRMGGWLYTEPMPAPPTDDDGEETGERAEYPAAFVAELSELLNRAPEMYAEALAAIIADDADEAEREAERAAMPARLAEALALCMAHVDRARKVSGGDGDIAAANARRVLDDYREQLRDADCHRDLTDDEARALAAVSAVLS